MHKYIYIRWYVCVGMCIYVCVYISVYIYVYICVYIYNNLTYYPVSQNVKKT